MGPINEPVTEECEGCGLSYNTGPGWEDGSYCIACYVERFPPRDIDALGNPVAGVWCDCMTGFGYDLIDVIHSQADHKDDCHGWTLSGPPCGGCFRCQAMQAAYYQEKERTQGF